MTRTRIQIALVALLSCALVAAIAITHPLPVLNLLAPSDGFSVLDDVRYGAGPRQKLDLYLPKQMSPRGRVPVVVFFYGGSWNRGERADYRFAAAALAQRGMMVVVPDYRLYPQAMYPAFLEDSARAVAWTLEHAAHYGGDAHRVFVMGHSAGAYNAAMLALDPRWLRATGHTPAEVAGLVGLAGPYNFLPIRNPEVKPVFHWPQTAADTQPLMHVSRAAPPALLIAPMEDELVDPTLNSAALSTALAQACVAVTLKRYPALDHYTSVGVLAPLLGWLAPVTTDVATFVVNGARGTVSGRCLPTPRR